MKIRSVFNAIVGASDLLAAAVSAALLVTCVGCSQGQGATAAMPAALTGPSADVPHGGSSSASTLPVEECAGAVALRLVATAGGVALNVDHVTIRLMDGSSVGGPGVFPGQTFSGLFGSTHVSAGTSRTFIFQTALTCGHARGHSVQTEAAIIDARNMRQSFVNVWPVH